MVSLGAKALTAVTAARPLSASEQNKAAEMSVFLICMRYSLVMVQCRFDS